MSRPSAQVLSGQGGRILDSSTDIHSAAKVVPAEGGEEGVKYIIMCGGSYPAWTTPRQLTPINGEPIVCRTIRLLREAGQDDITISSNDPAFDNLGVPVLHHDNHFIGYSRTGYWHECFYPAHEPTVYLMGDVVFSPAAIRTIIDTPTDDIEFFASAPPFAPDYPKPHAEPFAFKVVNHAHLRSACQKVVDLDKRGLFKRRPIAWELWQVIKGTELNRIVRNYTIINDYTCDVDKPGDVERMTVND